MRSARNTGRWRRIMIGMLACTTVVMPFIASNKAFAKRGGDDNRQTFYGRVQARPDVLPGKWLIGGQTFHAEGATEFDQAEGPLQVGSCAKVEVRNGRVHEIDSEPQRNCQ